MNPLVKSNVPVAVSKKNKFDLPSQHLTTANFMQFNIAYARQLMPGSHGKLNHKTFMRAEPLDKPCLGSAQVHNTCVLVPFRTVWEPFSDFITDTPHNQPSGTGIIANVPTINNSDLISFFVQFGSTSGSASSHDFSTGGNYYTFSEYGRQCLKVLESLGYKIVFGSKSDFAFSALPLLCCAKAYLDFYFPSAYAHYGVFATIDGIFQRQVTYFLSAAELNVIFSAILYVGYNDDFYSAIWDNPTAPNSGVGSTNFSLSDPSVITNPSSVVQTNEGTPIIDTKNTTTFSQYLDNSLNALTKYVKRHQLSSFTIDRYLAEFGIALDASKLKRSIFIGDDTFPFQIGDVMSTSDTSASGGASLGAYAGKGIGYSEGKMFEFNTDEFGYIFVISTIVPDISYIQGIDKNTRCISKLDFVTGEFDGLGPDIVRQTEVLVDFEESAYNLNANDTIFGFAPRYYQWKIPYDRMTGLFRINTQNTDLNGWSTARLFDPSDFYSNPALFKHNMDFVLGSDFLQYDRIFLGYGTSIVDPFFVVHRDDLTLYAPMKPLYDDCLFDDEDTETKVSLRVGGVKVN